MKIIQLHLCKDLLYYNLFKNKQTQNVTEINRMPPDEGCNLKSIFLIINPSELSKTYFREDKIVL